MEGFLLDSAATAQGKFLVNQQEQNEGQNVWEQFEFNWRSLVLLHASVCAYFRPFIYSTCGRDVLPLCNDDVILFAFIFYRTHG